MIVEPGNVLGFAFFGPLVLMLGGSLISGLLDLGDNVVGGIVEEVISGLAGAVVGALVDLAALILGFFWDAAEPELTAPWFYGAEAPYGVMVALSAPLLLAFFLAGVIQGVLRGDTAGMLRMALLRLPGSVLAMSVVILLADVLLDVADEMSATLLEGFRDDIAKVGTVLSLVAVQGGVPGMLLTLVFAAVGLLAAVLLLVELFVRSALLYLVAAFSPLIYAAAVWEPMRPGLRKLGEIGLALIVSKVAIALALAVSASALVAAWPGSGESTAIATPEQAAVQANQSMSQTVGVLVSAVVMFATAAFMPFVLWRLLPIAEGALVAQGIRGAPLRSGHMAASAATMALHNPATAALRASSAVGGRRNAAGEGGEESAGQGGGSASSSQAARSARRGPAATSGKRTQRASGGAGGQRRSSTSRPTEAPARAAGPSAGRRSGVGDRGGQQPSPPDHRPATTSDERVSQRPQRVSQRPPEGRRPTQPSPPSASPASERPKRGRA